MCAPTELITSGMSCMIWTLCDHTAFQFPYMTLAIDKVDEKLFPYMTLFIDKVDGCGLSNKEHHLCQAKKMKLMLY